jgi:general secretion pathway protein F
VPAYQYQALDPEGHVRQGAMQADTPRGVRMQLRERNLTTLTVDEVEGGSAGDASRLGANGRILVTRQLATLVRAGLPLDEALAALGDGAEGKARIVTMALRARVMEGATLAVAMGEFPGTFDHLYRASIAAGEQSGNLAEVLLRLATHLEARDAMRRRLIGALAYPVLLLLVAMLVVGGLMFYVVPEITAVFIRTGQALPLPTRLLLGISALLRTQVYWAGPLLLVALAALAGSWRRAAFRRWRGSRILRLPLLGRLAMAVDASRFARTLAMLGASAVPLLDALQLATQTVQNTVIRESLAHVATQVRAGAPLSQALSRNTRFPPVAVRMIASGERAGQVDSMLDEAAAQLERELDMAVSVSMAALGPAVILLVGAMVLFIVLAILLPIFEMNQLVR